MHGRLTKLADISGGQVRTGVDNSVCLSRLAEILTDIWWTLVSLLDLTQNEGRWVIRV